MLYQSATPSLPPIQPPDKTGYPANWSEISITLRNWTNHYCEVCSHHHDVSTWHILTVHHLDGNPNNNDWRNLLVCCQRCHLHVQAAYRPGQQVLFVKPAWMTIRGL
jgi:hypothetical protein